MRWVTRGGVVGVVPGCFPVEMEVFDLFGFASGEMFFWCFERAFFCVVRGFPLEIEVACFIVRFLKEGLFQRVFIVLICNGDVQNF